MGNYLADAAALTVYYAEGRLVQLARDATTQTTLADATVAANIGAAIQAAEAEIDGMLGVRFSVPVSPVSGRLKLCAARIALYHLAARKAEFAEIFERQYEAELKWLAQAQDRELGLGSEAVAEAAEVMTNLDASGGDTVLAGGGLDDF